MIPVFFYSLPTLSAEGKSSLNPSPSMSTAGGFPPAADAA